MREVTDVRYNQKKRAWKAKIKEEEQGRNDTVSADEVMFKLKMYERSFLTFPHEALLRKEAESKVRPFTSFVLKYGSAKAHLAAFMAGYRH